MLNGMVNLVVQKKNNRIPLKLLSKPINYYDIINYNNPNDNYFI